MKTLFNNELCEREFGNKVLQTSSLLKWAEGKNLLLRTSPPLGEYETVQVEALFCAIERGASELSPEDARAIIDSTPLLAEHPYTTRFKEPSPVHVWLVGASAHQQWRQLVTKAIADGELQLLDGVSLLPVGMGDDHLATKSPSIKQAGGIDWQGQCRAIADELHAKDVKAGAYSSTDDISHRVAEIAAERGIEGPQGRLSAANIKREALQGGRWIRKKST